METIPLILLRSRLAVCRLPANALLPEWAWLGEFVSFTLTADELSVVCEERFVPPEIKAERGWCALKFHGPLDFSLIGLLASVANVLAEANIGIFTISTYDTDYILFKEVSIDRTLAALNHAGYIVVKP